MGRDETYLQRQRLEKQGEALKNLDDAYMRAKEFELSDIDQRVTPQNIKHKVAKNVEFLLRREKLISPDMHVIIPEGGYGWFAGRDPTEGYFSGTFEVFWDADTIVATGGVHGGIIAGPHGGNMVLIDILVEDIRVKV
jgi:hypothetical protein